MGKLEIKLTWLGDQIREKIATAAIEAVDEINGRIATAAMAELVPGHGKRTGTLQRDIQTTPARREDMRVIGAVGNSQVTKAYALVIQRRYEYLTNGFAAVKPQSRSILQRHLAKVKT